MEKRLVGAVLGLMMLPLTTLSASEAQVVDGVEVRTSSGTETMRAQPEQEVPQGKVFRRPTIIFKHKQEQAVAKAKDEEEKFLYPSLAFLTQYDMWKLRLGDIALLQDNVRSLFRKHPDCRRISSNSKWEKEVGRVACSNTKAFLADGDEVIFTYAPNNEILTGATYFFNSDQRAYQFAENVESALGIAPVPTYKQTFDNGSLSIDSPMFSVDVHAASKGFMVSIDAYFQDRILDSETYAKARLQTIEFGDLTLGKTKLTDMPNKEALPKVCEDISPANDPNVKEYYGVCFGFPYESHMQFDFNAATGILETAVLSPIGMSTGALVEDWLTKKYGLSKYCRRIQSDVALREVKEKPRRGRQRLTRMKGRTASLFAGTCENPIIFTTDMRYVFENRYLNVDDVMNAFERRKEIATTSLEHNEAFDERGKAMKGFFE